MPLLFFYVWILGLGRISYRCTFGERALAAMRRCAGTRPGHLRHQPVLTNPTWLEHQTPQRIPRSSVNQLFEGEVPVKNIQNNCSLRNSRLRSPCAADSPPVRRPGHPPGRVHHDPYRTERNPPHRLRRTAPCHPCHPDGFENARTTEVGFRCGGRGTRTETSLPLLPVAVGLCSPGLGRIGRRDEPAPGEAKRSMSRDAKPCLRH